MNQSSSSARSLKIYITVVSLCLFLIPSCALIAYPFSVSNFIPSDKLLPLAYCVSPVAGILLTSIVSPQLVTAFRSEIADSRFKLTALLISTSTFGALLMCQFLIYPLGYLLHRLEPSVPATMTERVVRAGFGTRLCHWRADLVGDGLLVTRGVCGLSQTAIDALADGGTIQLEGFRSSYGFETARYKYSAGTTKGIRAGT
jgi:hypothetical protein